VFKVHALQAAFGDSLILESSTPLQKRFVLIDGGPHGIYAAVLRDQLAQIALGGGRSAHAPCGQAAAANSRFGTKAKSPLYDLRADPFDRSTSSIYYGDWHSPDEREHAERWLSWASERLKAVDPIGELLKDAWPSAALRTASPMPWNWD
jgi:hypothetical protein